MRATAILSLLTAAVLLVAAPGSAQDDWIGVYGDDEAGTCRINDMTPGLVYVYVFHQGSIPAIGSQFRVSASGGTTMSLVSTTVNPSFLSIGSPESGISFSYTSCQSTFPLQLLTLLYLSSGTTPACETIDIVPHPEAETGSVEIVDCSIQTLPVSSSQAVINPNLFCLCTGEPAPLTTVTTVPVGRTITVDAVDYTAPKSFQWTPGSSHQIGAPSPQGTADSTFTFVSWSDGGAQAHTVIAPGASTTLTATFEGVAIENTLRGVTIDTEPTGLSIFVDGTAYLAPQHFDWLEGSMHTVEALVQQYNQGFLRWSDGGARVHTVVVGASDMTLVATYYTNVPVQGVIGLYTDAGAQGCNLVDPSFTTVNVEVVHTGVMPSNTSQFRVTASPDMTMIYSGVSYHIGLQLGDIMDGVVITYIGCQTPPLHLATLSYFGLGTSMPCTYIDVAPDPSAASGKIEIVDCNLQVWEGVGGRLTVNGDESCLCGPPEVPPPAATITTTPAGLTVTVDGQPYTSPHDFTWTPGTVHTVSADSSQAYGPDSVAVYSYWSDGGARSHQVTMPDGDVTFRATHDVQKKTVSGVDETPVPEVVVLGQNAPNPFNPTTRIEFSIPEAREVQLYVYDVTGRLVRRLYDGPAPRGFTAVSWDGVNGSGHSVSSGVYFCRLRVGETTLTKKMVLIK